MGGRGRLRRNEEADLAAPGGLPALLTERAVPTGVLCLTHGDTSTPPGGPGDTSTPHVPHGGPGDPHVPHGGPGDPHVPHGGPGDPHVPHGGPGTRGCG
ncbi:hypothetical protein ACFW2X_15130 [Streptomyces antibioticus]|uniref:hypothetical protein n=1 Tax=Streptomyces antibioticus TaxID=1890 RepID=UPI003697CDAA